MTPEAIDHQLQALFPTQVQAPEWGSWQIETPGYRLLVLLSEDQSWLRILLPIVPLETARPFWEQLLEANFDSTQETRYAIHQNVLWGVFQHSCESLSTTDFVVAIQRLISLHEKGLSDYFSQLIENRVRQIIQVAKRQGQSLESTMQNLNRFYQEGLMGEIDQSGAMRDETLAAWRYQLERLWSQVEP